MRACGLTISLFPTFARQVAAPSALPEPWSIIMNGYVCALLTCREARFCFATLQTIFWSPALHASPFAVASLRSVRLRSGEKHVDAISCAESELCSRRRGTSESSASVWADTPAFIPVSSLVEEGERESESSPPNSVDKRSCTRAAATHHTPCRRCGRGQWPRRQRRTSATIK